MKEADDMMHPPDVYLLIRGVHIFIYLFFI